MEISSKRSPETTFSKMLIAGNGLGRWNTMPIRVRTSSGRVPGA